MRTGKSQTGRPECHSYFLDGAVAPKPGDELGRRGHGEVPLKIHLSVLASFFYQVKTRHARPDEDTTQQNTTVVIGAAYWQPRKLHKKNDVVASAYSPQKRHGPATATDSGGSLEASVTSSY